MQTKPSDRIIDAIRGSLIGGAAGDALGYAVEFVREDYIFTKYGKKGIESISYVKTARNVPYDISPIWIPHQWKDVFELNGNGQIFTFERLTPGRFRGDRFSAVGELIHEASSSGFPLKTSKVEYFVSPATGDLGYRETGDEITYRLGQSPSRRSGE